MPHEEVEAVIRLLQSRADLADVETLLTPREAKLLVDYINQLRIQVTRLHQAGMDCVSRAFEFGGPEDTGSLDYETEAVAVHGHHVTQPMRDLVGRPSSWLAQVISALTRYVGGGG